MKTHEMLVALAGNALQVGDVVSAIRSIAEENRQRLAAIPKRRTYTDLYHKQDWAQVSAKTNEVYNA